MPKYDWCKTWEKMQTYEWKNRIMFEEDKDIEKYMQEFVDDSIQFWKQESEFSKLTSLTLKGPENVRSNMEPSQEILSKKNEA